MRKKRITHSIIKNPSSLKGRFRLGSPDWYLLIIMCNFSLSTTAHYYAVENGYNDIPHKIDSESIANHFSILKSDLSEHSKKSEKTIFLSIFK